MWPGCTRSAALASRATAACTVRARSAAEMPVVTPVAASMETVKAVAVLGAVARGHRRQLQAFAAFAGQRQADQAARETGHEVDGGGADVVSSENQITFVLAVFLVNQDDHAACGQLGDELGDGGNQHRRIVGAHPKSKRPAP